MGYQICPKCNGSGKKWNRVIETDCVSVALNISMESPIPYKDEDGKIKLMYPENTCQVCKGKIIISCETGLPPC
jgi:DnaJ-class molecular chaperone